MVPQAGFEPATYRLRSGPIGFPAVREPSPKYDNGRITYVMKRHVLSIVRSHFLPRAYSVLIGLECSGENKHGMVMAKIGKRTVDGAQPNKAPWFLWDDELKGFGLLVQPTGAKAYILQYRIGGRGSPTRRYTIGKHGKITADIARVEAKKLLGLVAAGHDPTAEKSAARRAGGERLKEIVAVFMERHHRARGNRWSPEVQRTFDHDILPRWGDRQLAAITRSEVVDLLDEIVERGSPIQANRTLVVLRKFFNWCVDDRGLLSASPAHHVRKPSAETARDRVLTDAELAEVWHVAEGMGWPFGPCIRLLILTLQRRSEVAGMRWREISPDMTLWTIPGDRAKNGKVHEVPLAAAVRAILLTLPRIEDCDLVFSITGRTPIDNFGHTKSRMDATILARRRELAIRRGASIEKVEAMPEWVLHDLRRTGTTGMARLGVPPHVADKILNHQEGTIRGVAGVYNRFSYLPERRKALDQWAEHVLHIVELPSLAAAAA
jgi:integrase